MTHSDEDRKAAREWWESRWKEIHQRPDTTGLDEEDLFASYLAGLAAGRPRCQLTMMRELRDMYLDHIEGTDSVEFIKWDKLYGCAAEIVEAMESELAAPETEGE